MPYVDPIKNQKCQERYRQNNRRRLNAAARQCYQRDFVGVGVFVSQLKQKYGLTLDEDAALDEKQDWACAICQRETKTRLGVDHNHKTGKVRGLLCQGCNVALGQIESNEELYQKRLVYLHVHAD